MEGKNFVTSNTSADLMQSWHIPRPTLARSSNSSQGSTSGSTNSTQSARSGSLLLTAANLAQIHKESSSKDAVSTKDENLKYYLESSNNQLSIPIGDLKKASDPDSVSIASSMHFTVVNMNSRPQIRTRSFCKKHQLTVLVVTMSAIFTIGILAAIFLLEMRARKQPPH